MAETLSCHQHRLGWLEPACPRVVQAERFNHTRKSLTPMLLSWASKERIGAGLNRACTTSIRQQQGWTANQAIFLLSPALTIPEFLLLRFQTASFLRSATSLVTLCLKISWPDNPVLPFPVYSHRQIVIFTETLNIFSGKCSTDRCWDTRQRLSFPTQPTPNHRGTYPCQSSNRAISTALHSFIPCNMSIYTSA